MPGITAIENGKLGGRPKGAKSKTTLQREAVLKAIQQRAMEAADVLLNGQLTLARGQTYLYKIEKEEIIGPKGGKSYRNKKPELVTSQFEIENYLNGLVEEGDKDDDTDGNSVYYFLTTKDPNNQAIDSIFDRTFGKAQQKMDVTSDGEKITSSADDLKEITQKLNAIYRGAGLPSNGTPSDSLDKEA